MDNSAAIFIPARLDSSRFPKKVLYPIDGKPMVIRVLEQAQNLDLCRCYVACCGSEIKKIVEDHGGQAIITDPELQSGTDRVFAALETLEQKPEYVINLQGDTPVFAPQMLSETLAALKANESIDIATPATYCDDRSKAHDENTVKVAFENMDKHIPGKAIYFSRSSIPYGSPFTYSHVGIYVYRYNSLKKFVSLPQTFCEKTERLEQLRGLQNGINIWVVPVTGTALSVDTEQDVEVVLKALSVKC
ncbi:MAG: 3-deoxy-manno-octulosonate cytidylyltransferase [Holosporales bacterium]|jgi:3-deoxy-manno-octulosonate cytidylyltransferase (CMP-KDO synthetase)|nr:3-deoxy-manno-octulosonate cytidylyltransferase [Holosporales bacterium]